MARLCIFGCGGHARSVADVYLNLYPNDKLLFIDPNGMPGEQIFGFEVMKEPTAEILSAGKIFFGTGDNHFRKLLFGQYAKYNIPIIVSASAYLGLNAVIKPGCFVANFAHIGPQASIDENTIINTGAVVEHEVKVGKHCHIAPNATISGRTVIGNEVFVGAGATIIDKINVCSNVMIGAGSTVIHSIEAPGTYVGSPARKIN